jgi:hypothetical protein
MTDNYVDLDQLPEGDDEELSGDGSSDHGMRESPSPNPKGAAGAIEVQSESGDEEMQQQQHQADDVNARANVAVGARTVSDHRVGGEMAQVAVDHMASSKSHARADSNDNGDRKRARKAPGAMTDGVYGQSLLGGVASSRSGLVIDTVDDTTDSDALNGRRWGLASATTHDIDVAMTCVTELLCGAGRVSAASVAAGHALDVLPPCDSTLLRAMLRTLCHAGRALRSENTPETRRIAATQLRDLFDTLDSLARLRTASTHLSARTLGTMRAFLRCRASSRTSQKS